MVDEPDLRPRNHQVRLVHPAGDLTAVEVADSESSSVATRPVSATLEHCRPIGPASVLAAQLGSFGDAGDMHVAQRKQGDAVRGQSAAP